MGVAALCIRLLISVIVLQRAHGQEGNAVLQVVPNKLQFFEYDTVSLLCKGLDSSSEWKVVHNSRGKSLQCSNTRTPTTLTCTFKGIYKEESGEYWCEAGTKKRSNSVVITVNAGSVILESPALPVSEGKEVTLRCRNKTTSSSIFDTYFYKDGVLMNNSTTGNLIIPNVFKSDEGRYKCSISGAGESAENWLNVTASGFKLGGPITHSSSGNAAPWIVITVLLTVLLVVLGIHHFVKHYWPRVLLYLSTLSPRSDSAEETTEPSAADLSAVTYAAVRKNRQKKDEDGLSAHMYYILDLKDDNQEGPGVSAAVTNQPSADEFYSLLQ
ncbi:low affinity immunoglobulin gamma Fc region receptor III-like isoform X2 [Sphaeramia orbicularis]|uniref:low affinity immunoglobulin gamma Fc region receptor III-like isoform X2 n=1 Tax=Sphaeramia orbicularis TaxID=375764 RepID=UPI00117E3749|nr:low affinity immunoglobulin gamma Fc region receptor III-like isoform X2 [Sphaeramia orbicularis]